MPGRWTASSSREASCTWAMKNTDGTRITRQDAAAAYSTEKRNTIISLADTAVAEHTSTNTISSRRIAWTDTYRAFSARFFSNSLETFAKTAADKPNTMNIGTRDTKYAAP